MKEKYLRFVGIFVIANLLTACSGGFGALKVEDDVVPHMIAIDANGKTFQIEYVKDQCKKFYLSKEDCTDEQLIHFHINTIMKKELIKVAASNQKVKILLFIHGGLVPKREAAQQADEIKRIIDEENKLNVCSGAPYVYPIFVNWESSMGASYWNHLTKIRQGERRPWLAGLSSPFYFLGDAGRAISRMPITYAYQFYNMVRPLKVDDQTKISLYNTKFYTNGRNRNHGISLGEDKIGDWSKRIEKSTYIFPGFFKLITTPLLDIGGKSSWDNMLRRTKTLFRTSWDFKCQDGEGCMERKPNGGLSKLMRMLRELKKTFPANKFSVTLMGHSMGSIVASDILRMYSGTEDFDYDDIVYMAAASSIKDFENSVIPYLETHDSTNFFNLTLHPYREENENTFLDTVPRGSLLVWLDDFATIPATPADKTLGKWNNSMKFWPYIPKKIRRRISLKGFGVVNDSSSNITDPQKHGQFNDAKFKFWHRTFWQ